MSTLGVAMARGQVTSTNAPDPASATEAATAWGFSASVFTYVVPDSREYVQPTLAADYGRLHLEARYNYEDLDTGSLWVGYNFSGGGETFPWEFTPLLGGVFGNTDGIAPGYQGSIGWWKLELYSEGEYVFDTGDSSESYFYNWSELSLAPVDWFRFGLVTQRTRAYDQERDIQRGVLAGFSWRRLDFTTYVFNPDDKPTWVFGLEMSF